MCSCPGFLEARSCDLLHFFCRSFIPRQPAGNLRLHGPTLLRLGRSIGVCPTGALEASTGCSRNPRLSSDESELMELSSTLESAAQNQAMCSQLVGFDKE